MINWVLKLILLNLNAFAISVSSFQSTFQVCEIEDPKYKLCGITVAPTIPNDKYSIE